MTHYVTWTDMVKKMARAFITMLRVRGSHPAPENEVIYEQVSKDNGFERREISDQEIIIGHIGSS